MGRAFEYRKARKMKRWGHMARTFTKIGKEIEMAVKAAGPDPSSNLRLRLLMQNAKSENMPKENVERAIKRATDKDAADYKEVIYEGYGPHGIAVLVETATDNTNRTVASVRMYFNKYGGTLGTSGSVGFMFEHKCVFKFKPQAGADMEELELEMIDLGVDEFYPEEETVTVYAPYESFGAIQKWIEDKGFELVSGESVRIPTDTKELSDEQRESVNKLIEHLEEDDDVTNVYTTMKEEEGDEEEEE
ncbi:MAG: YebC/PmpR family DNA-binding transcriptional regulator [Alistipes sp.]|nr:YebC/PmpR family DNA-binding transcriptional regulator [Alistipes sp.]